MARQVIRTSVRELVNSALRSGDLMRGAFVSPRRLVQGTRLHQRLQRSRPAGYQAEVPVFHQVEQDGFVVEISGRVDGLITQREPVWVEEIKTTTQAWDPQWSGDPVDRAQARVYAFIVGSRLQCDHVDVRLTYVHLDTLDTRVQDERCTVADLERFVAELVHTYLRWAREYRAWCAERDRSLVDLSFPFPRLRAGQEELSALVADVLQSGGRAFVQAPTGIGKTISVLYAAVQGLGAGMVDKVFYLTPRTVVRAVAEKAAQDLRGAGLRLRSVTLTARDRICFHGPARAWCDPLDCPFARGYYDRLDPAVEEGLGLESLTRPVVEDLARRHRVCPFELSLELSSWVDLVICDYNHVFDPRAYLRRFFADGDVGAFLLVDEAHNLLDRAREMFSADLRSGAVRAVRRRLAPSFARLGEQLQRVEEELLDLGREEVGENAERGVSSSPPAELVSALEELAPEAEQVLARRMAGRDGEMLLELYYAALRFLHVAELFGSDYVCYVQRGREVHVRLFCLDPGRNLRAAADRAGGSVFFSATLTPLEYFRDLLGGQSTDALLSLDTPFPRENLHVVVADHVATTFRRRASSYAEVAAVIAAAVRARTGNYMAFFPSYRYLQSVLPHVASRLPEQARLQVQTPAMNEAQRADFLDVFAKDNEDTVIGFVVMGGLFAEGIDLVGERLVGAIVVGVGLPQVGAERELIRAHFDSLEIPGFDYAYTFPGLNRVLQAAGRVIRSETDRGVVVLVDERFARDSYQRLLPAWWRPVHRLHDADAVGASLAGFWSGTSQVTYEPL